MITPEQAVVYSIMICIGGAVATLLLSQSKSLAGWLCFLATSATAVLIFTACAGVLTGGPSAHPASFWALPGSGYELRFYVDGLSAIFLGLVAVMAVPWVTPLIRQLPGVGLESQPVQVTDEPAAVVAVSATAVRKAAALGGMLVAA